MQIEVKIKLLGNCLFSDGSGVPGSVDLDVMHDSQGFPYLNAKTFKGLFREAVMLYLAWTDRSETEIINKLFGRGGEGLTTAGLVFNNFEIKGSIKQAILSINKITPEEVLSAFTESRKYTQIEGGVAKDGSLRHYRMLKAGIELHGIISLDDSLKSDTELISIIESSISAIKWAGANRTRGLGRISAVIERESA